jgi:hypothetical protein
MGKKKHLNSYTETNKYFIISYKFPRICILHKLKGRKEGGREGGREAGKDEGRKKGKTIFFKEI